MVLVRWLLGRIILAIDALTKPRPISRQASAQQAIDKATANMSLYQFEACPFCVKVRRELTRYALKIELRDAKNNTDIKADLVNEGGRHKVPCLRIQHSDEHVQWLYGSNDIIAYLKGKFDLASP